MPYFYIVDKKQVLYLQEGKDRSEAINLFNDKRTVRHDVVQDAPYCERCKGKVPQPTFPDWFAYSFGEYRWKEQQIYCKHTVEIAI